MFNEFDKGLEEIKKLSTEMNKLESISAEMFDAMSRHDLDEVDRIERLRDKQLQVCENLVGIKVKRGKLDYSRFED